MGNLSEIESLIAAFRVRNNSVLGWLSDRADTLRDACGSIRDSWSGSFAGWHGRMYFREFERPTIREQFSGEWGGIHGIPDGWRERQTEEIEAKINELVGSGFDVRGFEKELPKVRKEAEKLRDDIAGLFSLYPFDTTTQKEKSIYETLEVFKFGDGKSVFINNGLPGTVMTRDSEALMQGTCIPSWLYYDGVAMEAEHFHKEVEKYLSTTERLVKQLKAKAHLPQTGGALAGLHQKVYEKCHSLYEKSEYAEAVEKGFKVVRDRLRELTTYETGSKAFGNTKLHIKGAAAQNVDSDFNEGVKFLTMAIDMFRNEKSHTSDAKISDPVRAYEYLRLSSLAMNLLDDAEILP